MKTPEFTADEIIFIWHCVRSGREQLIEAGDMNNAAIAFSLKCKIWDWLEATRKEKPEAIPTTPGASA